MNNVTLPPYGMPEYRPAASTDFSSTYLAMTVQNSEDSIARTESYSTGLSCRHFFGVVIEHKRTKYSHTQKKYIYI